jgi:CelD/BcsL family acetyltransferase involved in cellulose biosynthesis
MSNPDLASPFFCPEYTQAVAAVRGDVWVAVLQRDGRTVGFFPYQRAGLLIAEPVGDYMSDHQGVITERGLQYDMGQLLRACRLATWNFESVPKTQEALVPFRRSDLESPLIDVSRGYDRYLEDKHHSGGFIATLMRKSRKIEREVGPLRFVEHTSDPAALRRLIELKIDQYRRTSAANVFSSSWTRGLVEKVFTMQSASFGGILSILYAGERMVALHFGIRSSQVWHYWFPVYEPEYAAYSPGLLLLLRMAEKAASLGLQTIDLGHTSRVTYKNHLMNGAIPMCAGSAELWPWAPMVRQLHRYVRPVSALRRIVIPPHPSWVTSSTSN